MPPTRISEIIVSQKAALLENWLREQTGATTLRADLLSESELRADSSRFLDLLAAALQADGSLDTDSVRFEPVKQMLAQLSKTRGRQGFSPAETAAFVLSFKQPLYEVLRRERGPDADALFADVWPVTVLLDRLGFYTMETFQKAREEIIRRQQDEMLELSTPVVRLWDGVVAVPLVGTLDSTRTNLVMETLLNAIVETRSETAIIDITGVPMVDTLVAQHLLRTVAATRLMGADCIISGIRPQIAQTMVHLQIDMREVSTRATLAEALKLALKRSGHRITRVNSTSPPAAGGHHS